MELKGKDYTQIKSNIVEIFSNSSLDNKLYNFYKICSKGDIELFEYTLEVIYNDKEMLKNIDSYIMFSVVINNEKLEFLKYLLQKTKPNKKFIQNLLYNTDSMRLTSFAYVLNPKIYGILDYYRRTGKF